MIFLTRFFLIALIFFSNYILSSDLPIIFKKYHLDIKFLLDEKNFPLKEKDLPDLCADRIDYTLRN